MKKRKLILDAAIALLLAVFAVSAVQFCREMSQLDGDKKDFSELSSAVHENSSENTPQEQEPLSGDSETSCSVSEAPCGQSVDLSAIMAENADCVGWIQIPGTVVDYPVMYTPQEPERYLRLNFNREYSVSGVPFLDARCQPEGCHLIVYGHNMRNGTMFSILKSYKDHSFLDDHPVINYSTRTGTAAYRVFAVLQTDVNDSWYKYLNSDCSAAFDDAIAGIRNRSVADTSTIPQYGQQLLTLSTCCGAQKTDRLLIVAVRITDSEGG